MEELTRKYGGYRPHAKKREARWKYHLKWITMFIVAWTLFFALGWLSIVGGYKIISAALIGLVAMYAAISVTYNYHYDRR